ASMSFIPAPEIYNYDVPLITFPFNQVPNAGGELPLQPSFNSSYLNMQYLNGPIAENFLSYVAPTQTNTIAHSSHGNGMEENPLTFQNTGLTYAMLMPMQFSTNAPNHPTSMIQNPPFFHTASNTATASESIIKHHKIKNEIKELNKEIFIKKKRCDNAHSLAENFKQHLEETTCLVSKLKNEKYKFKNSNLHPKTWGKGVREEFNRIVNRLSWQQQKLRQYVSRYNNALETEKTESNNLKEMITARELLEKQLRA
ncbi:hypothetical protein ENBRE01_2706, partial [Enteropsectra breve]